MSDPVTANAQTKPAAKSRRKAASALPYKGVADELAFLRKTFRDLVRNYSARVEGEISSLHDAVVAESAARRKAPASRAHDLRDMLMLLQALEVKPAKGRRRDFKKIEAAVEEMRRIADAWD